MKKKYLFSVIVTVYKNFNFIEEAIESIVNQSCNNLEILIVDTCFTNDRKNQIINQFKKNQSRIRYFKCTNQNKATGARNFGSRFAKGQYLAFLDDDDIYKKSYLENIKKVIKIEKYDLIITDFLEFKNSHIVKKISLPLKFNINDLYIFNPGILPSNIVLKKKTFTKINGFDEKFTYSSDKIILIEVIKRNFSYFVLKKKLVLKRIHNNQVTNSYHNMFINNIKFYNEFKNEFILLVRCRFLKKLLILFIKSLFQHFKNKFLILNK
jgi:glycosyltransferase involved in cell wall biosynthesis